MKIYLVIAISFLFNSAYAEQEQSFERNLVDQIEVNGQKLLANVTATVARLVSGGNGHLTTILQHHVDTLKTDLAHLREKLNNSNPFQFYPRYLANAVAVGMANLEQHILTETEIVNRIVNEKHSGQPSVASLINLGEKTIKKAGDTLAKYENAPEYEQIEGGLHQVEHIVAKLAANNVTINQTELILNHQILTQYSMSLQALINRATWRLPCEHRCYPTNVTIDLVIDDSVAVLAFEELLQNHVTYLGKSITREEEKVAKLVNSSLGHLTHSIVHQIELQKVFLANIKAQQAEEDQIFTQVSMGLFMNEMLRLDFRYEEETEIVGAILNKTSHRNETSQQLHSRAVLLTKMGNDFITKHKHSVEVPEVRFELHTLDGVLQELKSVKADDRAVLVQIEDQLDRIQRSLLHLFQQAIWIKL